MITENLMALGDWDLQLVADTPLEIRRKFHWGGNLFVTKTDLVDDGLDQNDLASIALYAGVITRKANKTGRYGGRGMLFYLQSGKGSSGFQGSSPDDLYAISLPNDFGTILTNVLSSGTIANGLLVGSDFSSTATAVNEKADYFAPPFKGPLDTFAQQTGNEYRVTPAGLIDYGVAESLFRSDPQVIIGPGLTGTEDGLTALKVRDWDVAGDIDNYRNYAKVFSSDGLSAAVGGATGSYIGPGGVNADVFYKWGSSAFFGNHRADYMAEITVLDSDDFDDVANLAPALSAVHDDVHYEITCTIDHPIVRGLIEPGDWVYLHDPLEGLVDNDNPVNFAGQIIYPVKMRVVGLTWPIEQCMGVYVYYDDEVTNVTQWVRPDDGLASPEIGSLPLPLVPSKFASLIY